MTEHEAVAHITEMRDIIRWMLALIDDKEQMPEPGDEIYEAMALALEKTKNVEKSQSACKAKTYQTMLFNFVSNV